MEKSNNFKLMFNKDPDIIGQIVILSPLDKRYVVNDIDRRGTLYGIAREWKETSPNTKGILAGEILNLEESPVVPGGFHTFSDPKVINKEASDYFIESNPALFI